MIQIKNSEQLAIMRKAGRITGEAILAAREHIKEGVSTKEIDTVIRHYIEKCGAVPSFLGYGGFPGSACISINNEVIHGIPKADRILHEGDIVKIDVGACYHGFHGDSANTFGVGKISEEAAALIKVTRESFFRAAKKAVAGGRIGDIGRAVSEYAESFGYGVVRKYVGHGVGQNLHEDPEVPNFGTAGRGARLYPGMTIAIEPMINMGTADVKVLSDGWTVITADGSLSAHYEHTVAVTDADPVFLTFVEE
ncbi:MAG: type I methionyl aminopeptidase [Clostridiales bacterium]|nr:MAG: type I methionyl aminopeptidase [Clostridiales bacterium]